MTNIHLFEFSDVLDSCSDDYVAKVPAGISNTEGLFQALYDVLKLPGYFGFNWNALSDCLRDFHWINSFNVILQHTDLPRIPSTDLCLYLEILAEAKVDWKTSKSHSLKVVFPIETRESILSLIC